MPSVRLRQEVSHLCLLNSSRQMGRRRAGWEARWQPMAQQLLPAHPVPSLGNTSTRARSMYSGMALPPNPTSSDIPDASYLPLIDRQCTTPSCDPVYTRPLEIATPL